MPLQPVPDRLPRSAADRFRLLFGPDERPVFQSGEAFCELREGRILCGLTACCAPVIPGTQGRRGWKEHVHEMGEDTRKPWKMQGFCISAYTCCPSLHLFAGVVGCRETGSVVASFPPACYPYRGSGGSQ
jgi:hypothetical protein